MNDPNINNYSTFIIFVTILFLLSSCAKPPILLSYRTEYKNTERNSLKSIVIISDSTLNYVVSYGGLGAGTTLRYKIIDSLLITDTVDIYGSLDFEYYTDENWENKFFFSKDSLVNIMSGETFFNINKGTGNHKHRYIIMNDKKQRITRINSNRVLNEIDLTRYNIRPATASEKIKHGININSSTLIVTEK